MQSTVDALVKKCKIKQLNVKIFQLYKLLNFELQENFKLSTDAAFYGNVLICIEYSVLSFTFSSLLCNHFSISKHTHTCTLNSYSILLLEISIKFSNYVKHKEILQWMWSILTRQHHTVCLNLIKIEELFGFADENAFFYLEIFK
jgi:hypothetical protein